MINLIATARTIIILLQGLLSNDIEELQSTSHQTVVCYSGIDKTIQCLNGMSLVFGLSMYYQL